MNLSIQALIEQVAAAKSAAIAPNTSKSYGSGWQSWQRWADKHGIRCLPAKPEELQIWLVALDVEGKKPNTLRAYLAAVGHHHRNCLIEDPTRDPEVQQTMRGINRRAAARGYTPKQAKPLRWHHIQQITQHAEKQLARLDLRAEDKQKLLTDIAMLSLCHDAALRCSELLALTWSDISCSDDAITGRVLIRRSKTDQMAEGAVCPLSAYTLQAIERIRPPEAQPEQRIFPISASTVRRRFKAAAQAAGIDPTGITTHSPRIGMAQDLAAGGVDMPALMIAGRWKQPATVARYIRNLAADHTPVAQHLQTQDFTPEEPSPPALPAKSPSRLREARMGFVSAVVETIPVFGHTLAAKLHPTAQNTARKAPSLASYPIRSLVKTLAAQLATFSPRMGDRVGQGRSRSTSWPRLITLRRLARSANTVTSAAESPSTTSKSAAIPGASVPTSPSMRRAMAPLTVAQAMA